jgi:hypothetical protein
MSRTTAIAKTKYQASALPKIKNRPFPFPKNGSGLLFLNFASSEKCVGH